MKIQTLVPLERIEQKIILNRCQKVILDKDLADLYAVSSSRFNEAVKRNLKRFPPDFMLHLSKKEHEFLTSQFAILKRGRGEHRKYLPYAFTERGALAAAFVLKSPTAVEVSTQVVRTFVRLRQILASHVDLARKLKELEEKYDKRFLFVFKELRKLMTPPPLPPKRPIGFDKK